MAKLQACPLVFRISSQPPRLGSQQQKLVSLTSVYRLIRGSCKKNSEVSVGFFNMRSLLNSPQFGARCFSCSFVEEGARRSEKALPWLATSSDREQKRVVKNEMNKGFKSSWEESAEKFLKGGSSGVQIREARKFDKRRSELRDSDRAIPVEGNEEDEGGDAEIINDPRWDTIRNRVGKFVQEKPGFERADFRKWSSQENWGRKTWKEAKESSVPTLVGEGIYGVGPVLAALSAARRELYTLYVQEGLDLSTNNRKKKDKKGFETVLKMAEKAELSIKEISKHDLNMVVDNRPHQGLVLDASPLEMVGIKELEPISPEEGRNHLWLALDEVTDPQNLGAIIRSAYFFGASGVVLCAKNSAPLSGVVSKASAGSLEFLELRSCKNMMQFLSSSAGNGWRVLGASVSSRAVPLNAVVPGAPTILVLGSEGTGLRPLVERSCTQLIRIPGNPPIDLMVAGDDDVEVIENAGQEFSAFLAVESLNVSVAAGVLLNHLTVSNCNSTGLPH